MKFIRLSTLVTLFLGCTISSIQGQFIETAIEIDPWYDGLNGFYTHRLPLNTSDSICSYEFDPDKWINIYDVPFFIDYDQNKFCGSGSEAKDIISIIFPEHPREVLYLINTVFPKTEIFGFGGTSIPLNVLDRAERCVFDIEYVDGMHDQLIPINADFKIYGFTGGRAMYSVKASDGKRIKKITFYDKMRNASFHVMAVTSNVNQPIIAEPSVPSVWYPKVKKAELSDAQFLFNLDEGLTWKGIESAMFSGLLDMHASAVFNLNIDGVDLRSNLWKIDDVINMNDGMTYHLSYQQEIINLEAVLNVEFNGEREIEMNLKVYNMGNNELTGTLFFPILENLSLGSVSSTWYAYARNGLVVNNVPCQWRDYIGSEKPLQVDGIFNPDLGVGLGFYPRDTTDIFRWYNLSKDREGVSYTLEYTPATVSKGGQWKSVNFAIAVVPGDWKDQFKIYKEWIATWYKPIVPRLDWFKKTFAFVSDDTPKHRVNDYVENGKKFKKRWGVLDFYHVFGWSFTGEDENTGAYWGDYSKYDRVGGKDNLKRQIDYYQNTQQVPFSLYVDAYLMSPSSENVSDNLKEKWAIIGIDQKPIKPFSSYAMCPYIPEWRSYLVDVYKRLDRELGLQGIYNDETGMYMRSRACYSTKHGHPSPTYHNEGEIALLKEIKQALPKTAIYNEMGATDVMSQYCDGSFGYTTFWGIYTPRAWKNPVVHPSYNQLAPHFLHLQRFACPDFKTFEMNMQSVPWKNGNWYIGKFPFFNGNGYYQKHYDGLDGDKEAVEMFKKFRELQDRYKNEFSSMDVEPLVQSIMPNVYINRFTTDERDVYTIYNANYRSVNGDIFKMYGNERSIVQDLLEHRQIYMTQEGKDEVILQFEMKPHELLCIVHEHKEN